MIGNCKKSCIANDSDDAVSNAKRSQMKNTFFSVFLLLTVP